MTTTKFQDLPIGSEFVRIKDGKQVEHHYFLKFPPGNPSIPVRLMG